MSWLRIDDEFEDHPKVDPLTDGAHRLWMRAACWCRKKSNERSNGFVPRALLRTIARNSATQEELEALAAELVASNGGGMFSEGLWEPVEGGWRFHDWHRYQLPGSVEPLSKAEAGRIGGLKSVQVRKSISGSASPKKRTKHPRKNTPQIPSFVEAPPKHPEAPLKSASKQIEAPLPLPFRKTSDLSAAADHKDLPGSARVRQNPQGEPQDPENGTSAEPEQPENPGSSPAGSALPLAKTRFPTDLAEALALPVEERAKFCESDPHRADYLQPAEWPEVKAVAAALSGASGLALPRLGSYTRDSGVRALAGLYAAGFTESELVQAAQALPSEPWWQQGRRSLGSLSPEVVRRALAPKPEPASGKFRRADPAEDAEARRARRNNLIDDAKAGRYGPKYRARAELGSDLAALADELESKPQRGLNALVSGIGRRV